MKKEGDAGVSAVCPRTSVDLKVQQDESGGMSRFPEKDDEITTELSKRDRVGEIASGRVGRSAEGREPEREYQLRVARLKAKWCSASESERVNEQWSAEGVRMEE